MINGNKKGEKLIKRVIPQMYDIRPVTKSGSLNLERIQGVALASKNGESGRKYREEVKTTKDILPQKHHLKTGKNFEGEPMIDLVQKKSLEEKTLRSSEIFLDDTDADNIKSIKLEFSSLREKLEDSHPNSGNSPVYFSKRESPRASAKFQKNRVEAKNESLRYLWEQGTKRRDEIDKFSDTKNKKKHPWGEFSLGDLFKFRKYFDSIFALKFATSFSGLAIFVFLIIMGANLLYKGLKVKESSLLRASEAVASLSQAKDGMASRDFSGAAVNFQDASEKFAQIEKDLNGLGGILVESTRYLPFLSKLSSGYHLAKAGEDFSQAGSLSGEVLAELNGIKNPLDSNDKQPVSYLDIFKKSDERVKKISALLSNAKNHLEKINISDVPEERRSDFLALKEKMPEINEFLSAYVNDSKVFSDLLGGYGPRKYLFLFQNNQEMRPTGGFIGTYAILEIFNGQVKNFKVDGIFNPDGQLKERIVPPEPIQKISANWSLHDSNWFPDFPKSAEKAAWFYEKTGGPTVDGVITMTPTVMEKLLSVTGPIEMPEYELTIDKDNFLETVQKEVEIDYDKELNQPKKILADLAPKILDRIFNSRGFSDIAKTMDILAGSLNEKQILIYSKNFEVEKILSSQGWSGEVLKTQKDYLSVINTNINGFKTDGMIEEKISHKSEIQKDGSIVDTVTITRRHNGGDTPYDWWNRVNADYMRLYVPEGAQLISVEGQTREFNSPPLDYVALGYKIDPQLKMEEDLARIDEESGTKISVDSGKTVFANWVYVSPKESTEITYKYLLPFKIKTDPKSKPADTYSILFQKQSGSLGSELEAQVTYPQEYEAIWKYPAEKIEKMGNLSEGRLGFKMKATLNADRFIGVAFSEK